MTIQRTLPAQPQLRRDAAVMLPRDGELRIALSARRVVTVTPASAELARWLTLLDGTVGLEDAVAESPVEPEDARYLLQELDSAGLLVDANAGLFFRHPASEQSDALRLAQQTRAGVVRIASGSLPPPAVSVAIEGPPGLVSGLRRALDLPGIRPVADAHAATLRLLIGDALDPSLREAADAAMAAGAPHLCVAVSAQDAVLLPLTVPGRTACSRCWTLQRDDRPQDWPAWTMHGRVPDPPRLPTHRRALVLSLIVEHVLHALPALDGRSATVERYLDFGVGTVSVRSVGSHPACGCTAAAA